MSPLDFVEGRTPIMLRMVLQTGAVRRGNGFLTAIHTTAWDDRGRPHTRCHVTCSAYVPLGAK